jgi:hypothetical protein
MLIAAGIEPTINFDVLRIQSGSMGVGVDPTVKFEVQANRAIKLGSAFISSGGNLANFATNEWFDGGGWHSAADGGLLQINGQDLGYFSQTGSAHTPRFTVLGTGNVGIANTSPTYKLDVTGLGHFTGLVDAANFVATSTTATSTFAGQLAVGSNALNVLSNGLVGIAASTPPYPLSVNGDVSVGDFIHFKANPTVNLFGLFPASGQMIITQGVTSVSDNWFIHYFGGAPNKVYLGDDATNSWVAGWPHVDVDQNSYRRGTAGSK